MPTWRAGRQPVLQHRCRCNPPASPVVHTAAGIDRGSRRRLRIGQGRLPDRLPRSFGAPKRRSRPADCFIEEIPCQFAPAGPEGSSSMGQQQIGVIRLDRSRALPPGECLFPLLIAIEHLRQFDGDSVKAARTVHGLRCGS